MADGSNVARGTGGILGLADGFNVADTDGAALGLADAIDGATDGTTDGIWALTLVVDPVNSSAIVQDVRRSVR